MLSANNLLKPVDGCAVAVPSQDMVLGSYWLTIDKPGEKGDKVDYEKLAKYKPDANGEYAREEDPYLMVPRFASFDAIEMAYENGSIGLHTPVKLRVGGIVDGEEISKFVVTTYGRLIFNKAIPQDLGYVDRTNPRTMFDPEIDFVCGKKQLSKIVDKTIKNYGPERTTQVLDSIKSMGFKYSTKGSISISISDVMIPETKEGYVKEAEAMVGKEVRVIKGPFKGSIGRLVRKQKQYYFLKIVTGMGVMVHVSRWYCEPLH